jgi:hypothetical protein
MTVYKYSKWDVFFTNPSQDAIEQSIEQKKVFEIFGINFLKVSLWVNTD